MKVRILSRAAYAGLACNIIASLPEIVAQGLLDGGTAEKVSDDTPADYTEETAPVEVVAEDADTNAKSDGAAPEPESDPNAQPQGSVPEPVADDAKKSK